MQTEQFVVGTEGHAIDGSTIYRKDYLKKVFVEYIIIENTILNQLPPKADFVHSYVDGTIDISPNVFKLNDKVIIVYT